MATTSLCGRSSIAFNFCRMTRRGTFIRVGAVWESMGECSQLLRCEHIYSHVLQSSEDHALQ